MKRLITILIEDEEPAEVTELLDDIKTFLHGELSGVTVIEIKSEDKND